MKTGHSDLNLVIISPLIFRSTENYLQCLRISTKCTFSVAGWNMIQVNSIDVSINIQNCVQILLSSTLGSPVGPRAMNIWKYDNIPIKLSWTIVWPSTSSYYFRITYSLKWNRSNFIGYNIKQSVGYKINPHSLEVQAPGFRLVLLLASLTLLLASPFHHHLLPTSWSPLLLALMSLDLIFRLLSLSWTFLTSISVTLGIFLFW